MTDDDQFEEAEVVTEEKSLATVDRSATALAAQARASIQARVWLALAHPRSLPKVRDLILSQVKRPSLAKRAVYAIERGKKEAVVDGRKQWVPNLVEGPSIKLANTLRIAMGNIGTSDAIVADDHETRTVEVTAIDYETNSSESRQIAVRKVVERKGSRDGRPPDRQIVGSRKNSYGDLVYLCVATEAEIQEAQNSQAARARRNAILALIPADIVEDAVAAAKAVAASAAAQQRAQLVSDLKSRYAKVGVTQAELAEYLGKAIDDASADELVGLAMLHTGITDRQTTWREAVQARVDARTETEPEPPKPKTKGAEALRAAVDRATKEEP